MVVLVVAWLAPMQHIPSRLSMAEVVGQHTAAQGALIHVQLIQAVFGRDVTTATAVDHQVVHQAEVEDTTVADVALKEEVVALRILTLEARSLRASKGIIFVTRGS